MTVESAAADARWKQWVARGDADDRRTMKTMTVVMLALAAGIGIWLTFTIVMY